MIKNYVLPLIFICFAVSFGYGQTTIAIQDFETVPATPTMTYTGGSIATGSGPFPAGDDNFVSGSQAIEVNNGTETVLFSTVNASGFTSVYFTCRLASFSGSTGNGADGADEVYVDISTDGGTTWSSELEVQGNSNSRWSFDTGTGSASTTYDGDDSATIFTPAGGNDRTTDGYSNITVNGLPNSTNLRVRLVMNNNGDNEYWIVDDAEIIGTPAAACTTPTAQPTSLVLNNITSSSIDGAFTASAADSYLVVASTSATLGANPVDGTSYSTGDSLGSGTVVQSSTATTFTASGLVQNTQYYFFVFAYNGAGCSGGPLYYTPSPLTGDDTTISGPCLTDNFNSGYGNWTGGSGTFNSSTAGITGNGVGFNDNNDDIITSVSLTDPTSISFIARASGVTSNYTINFQYSTAPGGPWTTVTSIVANGSNTGDITNTANTFNINLNLIGTYYLRILQSPRSGGSFYLDDVEIFCGASTPEPELQLVDSSASNQNCGYTIDFGNVASDGSTTDLTFDIENIGSSDLDISSYGITGDYTIVSPATPFTIAASGSQTVTVRFTPTANGTRTGVLTINNNDIDEGTCTVNLTGIGFTPTPEIDIERNTGGSIANGAAASTGRNTIFASTVMGNSTAPKTYYVSNEGTGDLSLVSIVSSNPAEFTISLNPGATTITAGTEVDFEIIFSPTGVGTRTGVITIRSDDADEDPYTFNVQGNGECAAGALTFLPDNGPVGTIVNVTSSTNNFGGSTTVTVNGIAAAITVISTSEIEVTIPSGATTGNLEINDDLGCLSSALFTVIDQLISSCEGNTGTPPLDLFFSEITDHGSGSHSYVEIFNGTGVAVNLANYEIRIHNNGTGTATNTIPLTGTLLNNDVFVLAFGSTDATNPYASHGYDQYDNASGVNEDDNIRLYYTPTNTWIDLWGDTAGNVFTVASKDYVYRRKNSGITAPSTTWDATDWDSFTPVDYSDIGNYDFSTGSPPTVNTHPSALAFDCEFSTSLWISGTEGHTGPVPADTQNLAYQWFYNVPGAATWTEILPTDTNYTGQQSAILNIPNTIGLDGYQYYCQLREDTATCFKASEAVKLDVRASIWDGTNWSAPPALDRYAIIDGDYDTSEITNGETSFEACSCTITDTHELLIEDNDFVRVDNNLVVDGTLVVRPYGSFVQVNDAGTVTGNVLTTASKISVVKKTAYLNSSQEYVYWSSPVSGETINNGLAEANLQQAYWFNGQNYLDATEETNNDNATIAGQDDIDDNGDDWQFAAGATVMAPGVGYAATQGIIPFGNELDYIFEGPFNNGVYNVPIYRNDSEMADNNWNFIGNPYPSAIDADLFLAANASIDQTAGPLNGAIFFWSHDTAADADTNGNQSLNYAQSDYAIINASGQTAGGEGVVPNRFIPSGQGFFVSMDDSATSTVVSGSVRTTDVVFNNSMRVTGNNDQFFRTTTTQTNRLWLNLTSDNGVFNQILIAYLDGATDANDGMYYDAKRNRSINVNATLYSLLDDSHTDKFTIQGKDPIGLDSNEVIPLGFYTAIDEATLYTISIPQFEGDFITNNTVYLKDNSLNVYHDLSANDYTFTSETGEFNERFEIVFTTTALSIDDAVLDANAITVVELTHDNVEFRIHSKQLTIAQVDILDLLGKQVHRFKGHNATEVYHLGQLSQATYIAKITLSNGQVINKKIIKK
ncbi:choice-of-anchor D domain-containing protein [Winogradskyella eckloniae]|uniref:choice-of-anchor D domain-containing protein n=1 Tax=Winogradskyella eckloniae TaxID=1089306 RepID=UPI001566069A|nr:choice-of-anchor D domain-containing protein [Winogradskyella eckloniae]NRD19035.1 choice-of-anchor D domain-containing protein [Winogradskyella eckloniae]